MVENSTNNRTINPRDFIKIAGVPVLNCLIIPFFEKSIPMIKNNTGRRNTNSFLNQLYTPPIPILLGI